MIGAFRRQSQRGGPMGRPSFFFMKPYPTDRRTLVEKGRFLLWKRPSCKSKILCYNRGIKH